jgi:outer membrane biogenesis lipoprotein LolB
MRLQMPSASKFFARLVLFKIVLVSAACVSLRPMPKLTRGLTNPAKQQVDAINSHGTEFRFKFSDKNQDGTYMFDKWVCAPGDQVIDMAAWLQELLVVIGKGSKK